jgi:hypothetical protein
MDKANQMEFLFEEGGMADDGLDRDPVSGNEVPSGSMSEEVRDDIPAQLSEGEYVVPADVVRFFGVKYFEDLRKDAKMGLTQMEQEGRIGGEPVDVEGDDTELTAEEQAELDAIMGMAEGGTVTTTYDRLPPQAVGNTGQEQQLSEMDQQMRRAFQEGGDVPAFTQVPTYYSQYNPGFSFMGSTPATTTPTIPTQTNVTLYSPQGVPVQLILPQDQARYDSLVSQGYSETPVVVAPQPQQPQQDSGDDNEMSPQEYQRELNRYQTGSANFSVEDFNSMRENPLAFGNSALDRSTTGAKVGGILAGLVGGPLIGGAVMTAGVLTPIAEARASLRIAESQNLEGTPEYLALQERINTRIEDLPFAAKAAMGMGNIATGSRYATAAQEYFDKMDAIDAWDAQRPDYLGTGPTGMETLNAVQNAAAGLTGPAAESYAESARSGYTGSGARNIAVGKISGVGGIEGVVADPTTGEVIRDTDKRTVYRDEEGRTYVKTGLLGRGREYRDIEGVPSNPSAPPVDSGGDDSGSDSDSGGSVICTALHNKGLLDSAIYRLDGQYGAMLELSQPEVLYGYRELATPLANYIQKDTLGATVTRTLVAPIAKAWANEMAHQMQPENYKGNLLGKAIIKLGYPVCAFVGKRSKEIVYGT